MEITIRFTGLLRNLAGRASTQVVLDQGSTLRAALVTLREEVPARFAEQVIEPLLAGGPPLALLLHNRAHLSGTDCLERSLAEGDVIAFVMPMAGG
jgi:molybdopterin converting factor small subunit